MAIKLGNIKQEFLAVKPYSAHPDDDHYWVVIYVWHKKMGEVSEEYVVHNFNSLTGGYDTGFYSRSFRDALAEFNRRGC